MPFKSDDVFDIVIEDLIVRMQKKPEVLYWSVSQNDTYKACECDECKEQYEIIRWIFWSHGPLCK